MPSQRQLFLNHVAQTSEFPLMLEILHAEGVFMYDIEGKAYLDLISGIGVSNVGHRHPNVVNAIKEQVDKHLHVMVYGEFVQSPQTQLAQALVKTLDASLDNVYFVNSGSEAVEGAIKLAKRYNGRSEIFSCSNAYHGSTQGALSLAGDETLKSKFRPLLPDHKQIPFGDVGALEEISDRTAAIIIEPIQGEAGVRQADKAYFNTLREKCNTTGTLLIMDEIQTGFGRTGRFWAHEHYGVLPDILVCAKGMGGGMPIGAFIASKDIMHCLTNAPVLGHITTFGGHPVCCAAGLATLNTILEENLMSGIPEKEALFHQLLQHSAIQEVRSMGLMAAVEFESFELLQTILQNLLDLGVLSDWFLFCDNSMRIAPPLTITQDEIKMACKKILQAIDMSI